MNPARDSLTTVPASPVQILPRPTGAARVLHTSDWHLGVTVRNISRAADHDAVVDEIVAIAAEARPDLILHTGDLFDGPRPPMVEFGRAIRALRRLAEVAPVVLLAGNHDSAAALEVLGIAVGDDHADDLAAGPYDPHAANRHRIRVHHKPTVPEKGSVATYPSAAGVDIRLAVLPFVHQNRLLTDFASLCEPNATYNDSIRKIIGSLTAVCFDGFDRTREVAVFASHLHVSGAATSSERKIHISNDYATDPAHLDAAFGYLAFGHIHVPQAVASGRGTYAGSVLEVDFGETGQAKRVVIVDLEPGRPTVVSSIPLTTGRRLHKITGALSELTRFADEVGTGIVEVTVRPEPADPDDLEATTGVNDRIIMIDGTAFDTLSAAVDTLLPDATVVSVIDGRNPHVTVADTVEVDDAARDSVEDAFKAWLVDSGSPLFSLDDAAGADPTRVIELFDEILAAVTSGEPPQPREAVALDQMGTH